jgi:hypothetical protein
MVYTITATASDFNNPVIRGYIRASGASATKVYIDVQDDTLASGYIITVFDDYDTFPRKPRRDQEVNYVDYDLAFETLPPTIKDLQAAYVEDTVAASFSFDFAPTTTALANGATISNYLWAVGDGTITVGTTTTKDITVSFPAGHRWVHFTVTDSNSVQHTIHFEVYVGDLITAAFTLHGAETLQWSGTFDGWNGTAPMFADVDNIDDNQRLVICVLDTYNGVAGAINTNIAVIGRYRRENTRTDGGNATARNMRSSDLVIEGFGASLANITVPKFNVTDKTTPTVWNDIDNPSPVRLAWHVLTRYTTAATIQSFDFLSADLNYQAGALAVSSQGCLSAINQVLDRYNARCNFSKDGTLRIRRDANFIASRGGLVTVANILAQDILTYQLETEYNESVGQVTGGGLHYDPTSADYLFFIAKAPSITSTIGEEVQQLNGQILDVTDNQNEALADLENRTASKLAAIASKVRLPLDLFDGWWFLEPSNYDRYNVTLAATLNLRGKALDNTVFWQLQDVSCNADIKAGTIGVRINQLEETSAGSAGRVSAIVPDASDVEIPLYPVVQPYSGNFNVDGSLFDNDDWGVAPEAFQVNEPLDANAINPMSLANRGIYNIYFAESSPVVTTFNSVLGELYTIQVSGEGDVLTQNNDTSINLLNGNGNAGLAPSDLTAPHGGASHAPGIYNAGSDAYYQGTIPATGGGMVTDVEYDLGDLLLRGFNITWEGNRTLTTTLGERTAQVSIDGVSKGTWGFTGGAYTNLTLPTGNQSFTPVSGIVLIHGAMDKEDGTSKVWLKTVRLDLREIIINKGDAFFYGYNVGDASSYAGGEGFLIDGASPAVVPVYTGGGHTYTFNITGTGSPFSFKFGDSDYSDNSWDALTVKVSGPGAS